MDVDLAHIADMRHDRQAPRVGGFRDLDVLADPASRVTSGWTKWTAPASRKPLKASAV